MTRRRFCANTSRCSKAWSNDPHRPAQRTVAKRAGMFDEQGQHMLFGVESTRDPLHRIERAPPMKSIMAVSMHKAGSTIIDQILLEFVQAKGYAIDRISLGVPKSPLPADEVYVSYQDKMLPDGVYYGVARGPYVSRMPVLKTMKIVIYTKSFCAYPNPSCSIWLHFFMTLPRDASKTIRSQGPGLPGNCARGWA